MLIVECAVSFPAEAFLPLLPLCFVLFFLLSLPLPRRVLFFSRQIPLVLLVGIIEDENWRYPIAHSLLFLVFPLSTPMNHPIYPFSSRGNALRITKSRTNIVHHYMT